MEQLLKNKTSFLQISLVIKETHLHGLSLQWHFTTGFKASTSGNYNRENNNSYIW
jgi:hypothetical protein